MKFLPAIFLIFITFSSTALSQQQVAASQGGKELLQLTGLKSIVKSLQAKAQDIHRQSDNIKKGIDRLEAFEQGYEVCDQNDETHVLGINSEISCRKVNYVTEVKDFSTLPIGSYLFMSQAEGRVECGYTYPNKTFNPAATGLAYGFGKAICKKTEM